MALPGSDPRLEDVRRRLIALLDAADYRATKRALEEGFQILKDWGITPTEWGLVDYILKRLRQGHPIREAPQGDPPGCHGIAYELKHADSSDLYIKLRIDEQSFGHELVIVISFHY